MIISQYNIESAFSRELCVSWGGLIIDECFMCVAIVCDVLLFIIGSKCRYLCIVCIFDYSQSLIQGKGACCKYRKISSDIDCILMRDPLDGIWLGWTHWRVVGDGNLAIRILFQKHFLLLDRKIFFWPKIVKQIILTK